MTNQTAHASLQAASGTSRS
jgi:hypothetical protein